MTDEANGEPVGRFLGRAREVAILRALLAGEGGTRCVAVTGEPGIGKSRLLTELGKLADTAGWTVRSARAAEFETHIPFGVFVTSLDDQLAKLGPQRLASLGQQQLALLATVFPAIPASGPDDLVDAERYRLHRAVRALLELVAEPSGLVLVFDDLHWADEGSVELLDHLLRHPPQARVVLALAGRPRQTSLRLWHALSRAATDGVAELLELAPLSQADAGHVMPEGLSRFRREELYRASGGNPFYLEALVRAGERGIAVGDAALHPDGAIPVAVHAVLAAELAALTPQERVVAHAAAVVGDDFEADSLAETAALDAGSVLSALDRLAERDLVRLDGATRRFRYRHPLVRSVAYQDAGPGWRLQAHGRAASALRSRGAPPAEFARHVERSAVRGDLEAIATLTDAAEATMHTTPATAGHFLRAAIRLLPDSESATPQRLILLGRLAHVLGATGDLRQARDTMQEVLRLLPAELTQIRAQTARACATVEQILGRYTEARAMLHSEWKRVEGVDAHSAAFLLVALVAGESVERENGQDRVAEAIAAAREVGDPMLLTTALSAATLIDRRADRLDEAAALLDALPDTDLVHDIDAAFWLSWSEVSADRLTAASRHMSRGLRLARASRQSHKIALLTAIRGMVHAYLGELEAATTCFDDSLESAELTGSEELRVMALTFGCWITTWRGDLAEALRLGKEAIVVDNQATAMSSWRSGQAEAMLAQAMLHAGDPHACIELLLTSGGGAELPAVGLRTRPLVYLMLTEAEVVAGRVAAAAAWADRAEDAAGQLDLPLRTAMAQQARAIATLPTDPAAAAPLAVAAAGTFGRIGAAVEAGRAHLVAATAFGGSGAMEQARTHLVSAPRIVHAVRRATVPAAGCARGAAPERARPPARKRRRAVRLDRP